MQQRVAGGDRVYMLERGRGAMGLARGSFVTDRRRARARGAGIGTATGQILRLLTQAAKRGEDCPTNRQLAAWVGLSGAVAASYRLRLLVRSGKIEIAEQGQGLPRLVTIVASGQQTRKVLG